MTLLPSLPTVGLPGQIASTKPWYADTCRYSGVTQAAVYTLDLNPIAAGIIQNAQYSIFLSGAPVLVTYQGSGGSAVQTLASQLANAISRYGFYWAVLESAGVIRLVDRVPGAQNPILLGMGLSGAILTQVTQAVTPQPLTAGTLVWYMPPDNTVSDSHRIVSTYDVASVQAGFVAARDLAGIVIRPDSNYGSIDAVAGDYFSVMRQGSIWVRNYGSATVDRRVTVLANHLAPQPMVPGGAIGVGTSMATLGYTSQHLMWDSIGLPNQVTRMKIQLN